MQALKRTEHQNLFGLFRAEFRSPYRMQCFGSIATKIWEVTSLIIVGGGAQVIELRCPRAVFCATDTTYTYVSSLQHQPGNKKQVQTPSRSKTLVSKRQQIDRLTGWWVRRYLTFYRYTPTYFAITIHRHILNCRESFILHTQCWTVDDLYCVMFYLPSIIDAQNGEIRRVSLMTSFS